MRRWTWLADYLRGQGFLPTELRADGDGWRNPAAFRAALVSFRLGRATLSRSASASAVLTTYGNEVDKSYSQKLCPVAPTGAVP